MYPLLCTKSVTILPLVAVKPMRSGCCKNRWNNNKNLINLMLVYKHAGSKPAPKFEICKTSSKCYQVNIRITQLRSFQNGNVWNGQEASSKIEETVKSIKEDESKKKCDSHLKTNIAEVSDETWQNKQTVWKKIKAELVHYYHGFRLLGLDIKISAKLIWRILRGHELNRREHRLLVKTTGDMFRLIPFSVFVIVPFMEFLLPIAIKIFPGLLPSTFQTATEKEDKLKQALKVKIEMAKFLQKTLDEMAVQSSDHRSDKAKEFAEFFHRVRAAGTVASNEEIMKFSKLFEDEITLDSLSRQQLVALCRVLDVQTFGTTNFLRFLLRMKLRSLAADDRLIEKEGIDSLTRVELQQACRARGMRAYGMPEQKLKEQLSQWLDLSLNKKVSPSLLLLSRALMVPDSISMSEKLKATISALPDSVITRTKGAIGEKEGKLDHKTNIEIIKIEEKEIEEERREEIEVTQTENKEHKMKSRTIPSDILFKDDKITTTDVKVLEQALGSIGKERKQLSVEIKELKEEMADYQEDIQELHQLKAEARGINDIEKIKVSKGAKRLFTKVNQMISKMDTVLSELETSEKKMIEEMQELSNGKESKPQVTAELIRIDELIVAIKKIQNVSDNHRLARISEILGTIDDDRDGAIRIEDVLKVIELIGKEDVNLSKKQLNELIDIMEKEEVFEVEDQIQKALENKENELAKQEEMLEVVEDILNDKQPVISEKSFNRQGVSPYPEEKKDVQISLNIKNSNSDSSSISHAESIHKTSLGTNSTPSSKKAEGSKQF